MTIVSNTLTEPDGSPLVNRPVSARLASDGFRPLRSEQIASVTSVRTDSTGLYELDLAAQSAIDPAGTHYVITHPDGSSWPVVVPDGAGPFWVRDILVEDPAAPSAVLAGVSAEALAEAVAPLITESAAAELVAPILPAAADAAAVLADAAQAAAVVDVRAEVNTPGSPLDVSLKAAFVTVLASTGAADQTARINDALSAVSPFGTRKTVRLLGAFTISAPLVIPSHTTLDAVDAVITLAPDSSCNMWQNRAARAKQRTTVGSMSAGSTTLTLTSGSFTSDDVGRSVVVHGTGESVHDPQQVDIGKMALHTRVVSVNGGTAVLAGATDYAVTDTAVDLYDRDVDITITGGVWDRGAGSGPFLYGDIFYSVLHRVDRLVVQNVDMRGTGGKYAINLADVTNFVVRDIRLAVNSDGVHVNGPSSSGSIERVTGSTGDDMVPLLGANEYAGELRGALPCGAITDVLVSEVGGASHGRVVALIGCPSRPLQRVTVRGLRGTTDNHVVGLTAWGAASGVWDIRDVLISDVTTLPPTGYSLVNIGNGSASPSTFSRIKAEGLRLSNDSGVGVNVGANITVEDLGISSSTLAQSAGAAGRLLRVNTGATIVGPILIDGVSAVFPSGSGEICYIEAPVEVSLSNVAVRNGGRAVWYQTAVAGDCLVRLNNVSATNGQLATVVGGSLTAVAGPCSAGAPAGGAFQVSGSTASMTVIGGPFTTTSSFPQVSKSSAQTLRANGMTLPADVSKLTGAKTGDVALNTNTGLSCGFGPCTYTATGKVWKNMNSGATYAMP